jgi:hypothetical protein
MIYFYAVFILYCYLSDTTHVIKAYTFVLLLSLVYKNWGNQNKICYTFNIQGCYTNGRMYRILLKIYQQC